MSMRGMRSFRLIFVFLMGLPLSLTSWAAHLNTPATTTAKSKTQKINESQRTKRRLHHLASARTAKPASGARVSSAHASSEHASPARLSSSAHLSTTTARRRYQERFHMSSFAEDIAEGDVTAGKITWFARLRLTRSAT